MIYYSPDSVVIQAYFYLHTVKFRKRFRSQSGLTVDVPLSDWALGHTMLACIYTRARVHTCRAIRIHNILISSFPEPTTDNRNDNGDMEPQGLAMQSR